LFFFCVFFLLVHDIHCIFSPTSFSPLIFDHFPFQLAQVGWVKT
jgi:hypothetical protein